jgi:N-acetylmuramoyl-L-alanine amidase
MRVLTKIIIHCSASDDPKQDDPLEIRNLHMSSKETKIKWGKYDTTGKGFSDIGYHYVITKDGSVHMGRRLDKIGAHCLGQNLESVGICLTGEHDFTPDQFFSLAWLLNDVLNNNPTIREVRPHSHYSDKSCPNFKLRIFDAGNGLQV